MSAPRHIATVATSIALPLTFPSCAIAQDNSPSDSVGEVSSVLDSIGTGGDEVRGTVIDISGTDSVTESHDSASLPIDPTQPLLLDDTAAPRPRFPSVFPKISP